MAIALKTLASHIKAESQVLGKLTVLLREEQRALIRGEIETLASYAEPKAKLLFELSLRADERAQLLNANGMTPNAAGMEQLLGMLEDDAAAVVTDWQLLLADTRVARQLNEINGTLIASRMRGTKQALGVLLAAAQIPGTYAADGSTVGLHSAHRLGVA